MGRLTRRSWLRPVQRWLGWGLSVAGMAWLVWPLLRPMLWQAHGAPVLVVLDGYHRLDWVLQRQARSGASVLLITCPATGQPTVMQMARHQHLAQPNQPAPPLLVIRHGFDTATQGVAMAHWLQQRSRLGLPAPAELMLVSDRHHFPRAWLVFQLAAGSRGSRVRAMPVPASSAPRTPANSPWWQDAPLWRDGLRLQLWRLTGSTGAFLQADAWQAKVRACGEVD